MRPIGPGGRMLFESGSGRFTRANGKVGVNENDGTRRSRGTDGSNPVPSAGESVSPAPFMVGGAKARRSPGCEPGRDQRTGRAGHEPARLVPFSLTGIDAVPPRKIKALNEKSPGLGPGHTLSRVALLQRASRLR